MNEEKKLKIVSLYADNYQNLSAIEIKFDPEGNVHFIKGDNGAGKTSIIEFIHWIFTGKKTIDDNSVQIGKEKMEGWVDVGEFKIERKFSPTSSGLKIKYPTGLTRESAKQEFLDTLANPDLTFNPFPFLNKKPEEKLKWMMDFLNIDFTEIDDKLSNLEIERRFKGKALREIGKIPEMEKVDYVTVSTLIAEKNKMQIEIDQELDEKRAFNQIQRDREVDIENESTLIKQMEVESKKMHDELLLYNAEIEERKDEFSKLLVPEKMKEVETELNTDEIDQQIIDADDTNVKHERWLQSVEKGKAKDEKQRQYDSLTQKIKGLRESKIEKMSEIKLGIDGFEIKEDGLYWQGMPVDHLSDSESLEFSMQLCLSTNPRLNVFFVDRGESIGLERMKMMEKFAQENDIQLIITQVSGVIPDEKQKNTFYLVEGKIN